MIGMWSAVWPNLLANILWIPVVWVWRRTATKEREWYAEHISDLHLEHRRTIKSIIDGKETLRGQSVDAGGDEG